MIGSRRVGFAVALLLAVLAPPVAAETISDATARELMVVLGMDKLGERIRTDSLPQLRQNAPGAPEEFWTAVTDALDPAVLDQRLMEVLRTRLDEETAQAAIAFYKTPAGTKLLAAQAGIAQDSATASRSWVESALRSASEKIQPPAPQDGAAPAQPAPAPAPAQ